MNCYHSNMTLPVAARIPLIAAAAVAAELGIERRTANKLAASGLLGRTYASDRGGWMCERTALTVFRANTLPLADKHPGAFIVRVDAATSETGDAAKIRPFRGWHAELANHPKAVAGWDRWWPISDPEALRGQTVLVQVGPVVVAAATIQNLEPEFGRWKLITVPDLNPEARQAFTPDGARLWLPLPPGAITTRIPDTLVAAQLLRLGEGVTARLDEQELYDDDGLPVTDNED